MPFTKQELLQRKREERLLDNSLANNNAAEFSAGVFDTVTLTAIFTMFTSETLITFLNATGRFFLFPFAALANILRSVAAWRQAYMEKFKKTDTIVRAVVETLVTIAITFAVVASLVATAIFGGLISPVIFAATLGLKAIFQIGSAGFYFGKATLSTDPLLKKGNLSAAKDNAVAALSTLLAVTAILFVFVLGKSVMAPFGIAAGIVGVGLTVHGVYRALNSKDSNFDKTVNSDDELEEVLVQSDTFPRGHTHGHTHDHVHGSDGRNEQEETSRNAVHALLDEETDQQRFHRFHKQSRPGASSATTSSSASVMHTLTRNGVSTAASTPSPTSSDEAAPSLHSNRSFSSPHSATANKGGSASTPSLVKLSVVNGNGKQTPATTTDALTELQKARMHV